MAMRKSQDVRYCESISYTYVMLRFFLLFLMLDPLVQAEMRHGVAVSVNGQKCDEFCSCENEMFPLMSIVKFPLSIVVLHRVEEGKLSMNQIFELSASDMDAQTWSPLQRRYPKGGTFALRELLQACICESDNNACNYLFSLVGGPQEVQHFFSQQYGSDFPLRVTQIEKSIKNPQGVEGNFAAPVAILQLLEDVYAAAYCSGEKSLLSAASASYLLEVMAQTHTGNLRLRAGLSNINIKFAHKTGSSGVANGRTLAHHDAGIIMRPDRSYACVVSFISDSNESEEQMNAQHSSTARIVNAALLKH